MKAPRFSYCIAILAITGIFVAFIVYAIGSPAVSKVNHPPVKAVAPARTTTSTASVAPAKKTTTRTEPPVDVVPSEKHLHAKEFNRHENADSLHNPSQQITRYTNEKSHTFIYFRAFFSYMFAPTPFFRCALE